MLARLSILLFCIAIAGIVLQIGPTPSHNEPETDKVDRDTRTSKHWNPQTGEFHWEGGTIRIPRGFEYSGLAGDDSLEGGWWSEEQKIGIRHDICCFAGTYVKRGSGNFEEWTVNGARVWLARTTSHSSMVQSPDSEMRFAVTFPDTCANFVTVGPLNSARHEELIRNLARSFQPNPDASRQVCLGDTPLTSR